MHAHGFSAIGDFTPDSRARDFIDNPLFGQARLQTLFHFCVANAWPSTSEKSRSIHGLALRIHGAVQAYDMAMLSEPLFFAASVASFKAFLRAHRADPLSGTTDPSRIAAYEAAFPDGARFSALLSRHAAPASHASTAYFSNNAFVFTGKGGSTNAARLSVYPDAGIQYLSQQQEVDLPDQFLEKEMDERLLLGPIGFTLYAQLPARGDSLTDPSAPWHGKHRLVLGRFRITALVENDGAAMAYTPARLPTAVALTDDPILLHRAVAYLPSEYRRLLVTALQSPSWRRLAVDRAAIQSQSNEEHD